MREHTGIDSEEGGLNFGRRNLSNLRYADGSILLAESSNDLKELLMKVKEDNDKTGLHFHPKTIRMY